MTNIYRNINFLCLLNLYISVVNKFYRYIEKKIISRKLQFQAIKIIIRKILWTLFFYLKYKFKIKKSVLIYRMLILEINVTNRAMKPTKVK